MANSTTKLSDITRFSKTHPEIAPIIQTTAGGAANEPALTIASDVMIELISQACNWKWNRFILPLFYTNGFQQDYALPGVVNLGWLEHGVLIDINNTAIPKPVWPLEVVRDLEFTSAQYGRPGQICWLPNDQLYYATWGAQNTGNGTIGLNPGPNMVIGPLLGVFAAPINPILQVADAFGNLWVLTTFGTTGGSNPFASNVNPVFPTSQNPTAIATTVTDGTVVWTAVNPKGMGIRVNPIPPQTGIVYQFYVAAQFRAFAFSNGPFTQLSQTIEPIPDDFAKYFRDGFIAMAYKHSQDPRIRGKAQDMEENWRKSIMNSRQQMDRERENQGFFAASVVQQSPGSLFPGPAYPFPIPM